MNKIAHRIKDTATAVRTKIQKRGKSALSFLLRSLSNVTYQPKRGFLQLKGKKKTRTLTVATVKTFAQTLRMMSQAKMLVENDEIITKREAYYASKNWDEARFDEQPESDTVLDDIEALSEVNREQLGFIPEEKGGEIAGQLDTGKPLRIDCTQFGSGAYSIPISVEHLKFEMKATFILTIETAGMFRRLADELKLPVYAFVDCDPYGMFNIYRTLKVGSGNAAHINRYFCVPNAHFLGATPQDIINYKLSTHPLKEVDIKRAKDALKNDPFVRHYKSWQDAINQLLDMGVRAEQQAFAVHDLNYVIEHYLPEKLAVTKNFLP